MRTRMGNKRVGPEKLSEDNPYSSRSRGGGDGGESS